MAPILSQRYTTGWPPANSPLSFYPGAVDAVPDVDSVAPARRRAIPLDVIVGGAVGADPSSPPG